MSMIMIVVLGFYVFLNLSGFFQKEKTKPKNRENLRTYQI